MNKQDQNESKTKFPWLFFGLSYGMSWLIWGALAVAGVSPSPLLLLSGMIAPSLVGVVLTQLDPDREHRRDFWKRLIDFKRIGIGWYGVIVFIFPVILVVALLFDRLLGGSSLSLVAIQKVLSDPLQLLVIFIMMFFGGALAEELGWRGYALDRLQSRWTALTSSILLGLIWGFWHLPLFFVKDTTQAKMGFGLEFWLFIFDAVLLSILFSWVYNNTSRSTLSAFLLHWMYNFCMNVVMLMGPLSLQVAVIKTIVSLVVCAAIVVGWGAKTMIRQPIGTVNNPVAENLP